MQIRSCTVDAYREERSHSLLVQADGFTLRLRNTVGPVKADVTDDGQLVIDGNETSAEVLQPLADTNPDQTVAEGATLDVVADPGDGITHVIGEYDNLPIYSPYHAVSEDGDVYAVHVFHEGGERDDVLGLEAPAEADHVRVVENTETGWAVPMEASEVRELFEEKLSAAIEVR